MTRALWWHCLSGIAGDMALASLLDAGADLDVVASGLESLSLEGWHMQAGPAARGGVVATYLRVEVDEPSSHSRPWAQVRALLEGAGGLPERARRRSLAVFAALADAEAAVHRAPVEDVHFHEVGGLDAIVDIVGTCLALEALAIEAVFASPVPLGRGTVHSAHGALPNPAPAVLRLLSGAPVLGTDDPVEMTTPTGAALLAALAGGFGPMPAMTLRASGYGAGSRDNPGRPNVVQAVIGDLASSDSEAAGAEGADEELVLVEANVDDLSGEVLGRLVPVLIEAGALDAWLVPAIGKKGRPAHVVTALSAPSQVASVTSTLLRQSGTLGLRRHQVLRTALERRWSEVTVDGHRVRVKIGPYRAKAEHEDCVTVAAATGRPLAEVAFLAEAAARALVPH
jgi:hypothetical protein